MMNEQMLHDTTLVGVGRIGGNDGMVPPRAVIFDLAGTLVEWPDDDPERRWALSYDHLVTVLPNRSLPGKGQYVCAPCTKRSVRTGGV